jgi:hypothetical protein
MIRRGAGTCVAKNNIFNGTMTRTFNNPTDMSAASARNITSQTPDAYAWIGTAVDSGTCDATEANKLHDGDQNFQTTCKVGYIVKNTTDDTYTYITAIVDDGELTVNDDIFVSGETYEISENFYRSVTFENQGGSDYHLDAAETIAMDNGEDLDPDGDGYLNITDDIDGDARDSSTPDIGADEMAAVGALTVNVNDGLTISDSTTAEVTTLEVDVNEDISIGESISNTLTPLEVSVNDGLDIGEYIRPVISHWEVSVNEDISIGEEISTDTITSLNVNVADGLTIGDDTSLTISPLKVSVNDNVETLPDERVYNGHFTDWTADDPDDWNVTEGAGSEVSEVGQGEGNGGSGSGYCNLYSIGLPVVIDQTLTLVSGNRYVLTINVDTIVTDGVRVEDNDASPEFTTTLYTSTGIKTIYFTASKSYLNLTLQAANLGACDVTIDDVSVREVSAVITPFFVDVNDGLTIGESISEVLTSLEVSVSDGLTVGEDVTVDVASVETLTVNVSDGLTVGEDITVEPWWEVTSARYDSDCSDNLGSTCTEALDGTDMWVHNEDETHWLILDLGKPYNILKIRSRSDSLNDPTDVDVYVSSGNGNWGAAVASNITSWQDTEEFSPVDSTDKDGRYIKIEIIDTEHGTDYLAYGQWPDSFTIFEIMVSDSNTLQVDVSDGVTVGEDISTSVLEGVLTVNVSDGLTVGESVDLTANPLEVSVSDGLTVEESISLTANPLEVSVNEDISIGEDITAGLVEEGELNVNDDLSISEEISLTATPLKISVSDGLTVGEDITVDRIMPDLTIDVNDGLTIAESIALTPNPLEIEVNDGLTIGESVTPAISTGDLSVSVADGLSVGEYIGEVLTPLEIDVTDGLTIEDYRNVSIPGLIVAVPIISSNGIHSAIFGGVILN